MNTPSQVSYPWGPSGCVAAVSITFDNLGEAVELERGTWPETMPLGPASLCGKGPSCNLGDA